MKNFLLRILPSTFVYADHLTSSARRLLTRLIVALLGLVLACVAVGFLNDRNWTDVVVGALFAWATSFIVWAITSYRAKSEDTAIELRRVAELDLLHSRLNHVAAKLGLPLLDLQGEIESVLSTREERLAHFAGLDEYRRSGAVSEWWDPIALGITDPPDEESPDRQ